MSFRVCRVLVPAARALGAGETRNVKDPVFICLVLGGGIVCLLVFNTNSLALAILVYNQPHFDNSVTQRTKFT